MLLSTPLEGELPASVIVFCPTQCWWQEFKDATPSEVAGWIVDGDRNLFDLWRRGAKILFMIPGADVVVDPDILVVGD